MLINLPSGRSIGSNPFIICEIGSNWKNIDDCLLSIRTARRCGADAVKFQAFDHESLYGMPGKMNHELPLEWLPVLKNETTTCNIEFMCSAFSPGLIDIVNPYVNIHKLASSELTHIRMLEKYRDLKKPLILSTGGANFRDIGKSLNILGDLEKVVLYCVAAYPARYINFGKMLELQKTFNTLIGFSDHTTDINIIPSTAIKEGACVIEKHANFTTHTDTPDAGHSLNKQEFEAMVLSIRHPTIVSDHTHDPINEEKPMYSRHNRRLIAIKDIKCGEVLLENENFGIFRSLTNSTDSFNSFMIPNVQNKTALRDIPCGLAIAPGDL